MIVGDDLDLSLWALHGLTTLVYGLAQQPRQLVAYYPQPDDYYAIPRPDSTAYQSCPPKYA
jgi:hypothetical protein